MRSEFDFIHHIKDRFVLKHVGDDCAVLPKDDRTDMVVTADLLVEDIDFRLAWTTPAFLGHKTLAVSLSDVAAMGAEPKWALISIAVPEQLWASDFLDKFYEGWHALSRQFGVTLIGGDVSRSPDKVVIDSVVFGEVPKGTAIRRSGAKAGDGIFVSGSLGGASGGLEQLRAGSRWSDDMVMAEQQLLLRQLRPDSRRVLGPKIREMGASAMIDVSDGLSSDLAHICEASGCGAVIYADRIPVDPALASFTDDLDGRLNLALHGGEDFELLFTGDTKNFSEALNGDISLIGEVTANVGVIELIRDGGREPIYAKGFQHFR